ncbi:MAG TPA: haloacid dehalogenase type II [Gammaproteobacteria bacterium]
MAVQALLFDVFGTVVDWRSSIIREGEALGRRLGVEVDWTAFADAWRGLYQPSMEAVRSGRREWMILDELHRESLLVLLERFGLGGRLDEAQIDEFNRAWHRLDPWPDTLAGLTRLRTRFTLATLSNGNVALLVNMAKRIGLPWDAVLGAETARAYKTLPEAYLRTAAMLGRAPGECMLVAAHNDDLRKAQALGFATAFVCRPTEYGPAQREDLAPDGAWDHAVDSMTALADALGC